MFEFMSVNVFSIKYEYTVTVMQIYTCGKKWEIVTEVV